MSSPLSVAQADFALSLLRESGNGSESAIISPFSIAVALAMTYAGADGQTKTEINQALAKGVEDKTVHAHFAELVSDLSKAADGYTLSTANRVYVHNNFALHEAFENIIKEKYGGQLHAADFTQGAAVANEINHWVESQTNSKIKDLVSADNIKEDSRLMLVNAVYFKGDWALKFNESRTTKKPFYVSEGNEREVDMMKMKDKFPYMEDPDMQILGLPYKNEEVVMYVFLPKEKFGLAKLEKEMSGQRMLDLINDCEKIEIEVELPKFKLEKKLDLVETLQKLGITEAFDGRANFSGISDEPLYISDVIHKAFIEVNEEGSEAAAATGVGIMMMCLRPDPPPFIADHPFMFAIVKNATVIFIGSHF